MQSGGRGRTAGRARSKKQKKKRKRRQARHDVDRARPQPKPQHIAEEAEKGYDLMMIGLDKTVVAQRRIRRRHHQPCSRLRRAARHHRRARRSCDNPLRGQAQHPGAGQRHRSLAPRRRGRDRRCPRDESADHRALCGAWRYRRNAEEALARHTRKRSSRTSCSSPNGYDVEHQDRGARRRRRRRGDPQGNAPAAQHNLIVMGVGRRPGEKLFFGDTAAALLEKSDRSLLFVAT